MYVCWLWQKIHKILTFEGKNGSNISILTKNIVTFYGYFSLKGNLHFKKNIENSVTGLTPPPILAKIMENFEKYLLFYALKN